jgi:predicted nucleic acid-binding protein
MNAVDTNILLYAVDQRDLVKRRAARQFLISLSRGPSPTFLLWQVACEFLAQLRRWHTIGMLVPGEPELYLRFARRLFTLLAPAEPVLDQALYLFTRHSLSHWDSMLVAACIEAGIDTLYTENMGAPRQIESVQLVNPFVP